MSLLNDRTENDVILLKDNELVAAINKGKFPVLAGSGVDDPDENEAVIFYNSETMQTEIRANVGGTIHKRYL